MDLIFFWLTVEQVTLQQNIQKPSTKINNIYLSILNNMDGHYITLAERVFFINSEFFFLLFTDINNIISRSNK